VKSIFWLLLVLGLPIGFSGCGGNSASGPPPPPPVTNTFAYLRSVGHFTPYQIKVMKSDGSQAVIGSPDYFLSVRLSPDGKKIVYSYSAANGYQIGIMNADGSGQTTLTTTGGVYPQFAFNGSKIVYEDEASGGVVLMNADGTNPITLSQSGYSYWWPSISPNGSLIVMGFSQPGGATGLATMNIDGSGFKVIEYCNYCYTPTFSADGTRLLLQDDPQAYLWSINLDGTMPRQLTTTSTNLGPVVVGNQVMYDAIPAGTQNPDWGSYRIFSMNPDGSNQTQVTTDSAFDGFMTSEAPYPQ